MTNPDQLERDAAKTRESLGQDVNRLNDKVSPSSFLERRKAKLQDSAGSIKDRLMGSSDTPGQAAKDKAGSAVSSVKDKTDALGSKLSDAASTDALRGQTQGNPIAAGLIAFGVGWLLSSLVPASQAEQTAASKVEATAGDPLKQSAQEVAGNLQQPLQESAEAVKSAATDAAAKTTDHARSAASDVSGKARDAAQDQTQR